jgi:hypothetical protein
VAAATGAAVVARSPDGAATVAAAALATIGVVVPALAIAVRAPALVAASAASLGAAYAVSRAAAGGTPDVHAPLVAAGLLLACELAYWAHELRATSPDEPGALPRRLAWLAVLAVATIVLGTALLALSDLVRVEGIAVEAAGAIAAAAVVAGLLLLTRDAARRQDADAR